jgi:hypothetical protein
MQLLISLCTFHSHIGYIHDDAHLGNFLFHKVPPGGYWHYELIYKNLYNNAKETVNIYVPNVGYLVVLWDPGMAKPIDPYYDDIPFVDYNRVISLIGRISQIPLYKTKGMKPVPPNIFMPFEKIYNFIESDPYKNTVFQHVASHKDKYFKHILFDSKALPAGQTIINKKPYKIYSF